MDHAQMVAQLTPAISLRRQLDPRATIPNSATYADPVLKVRPLHAAERTFADETLDTILVEHGDRRRSRPTLRPDRILQQPASRGPGFPGLSPPTIRLLAEGISVLTGRPTAYVQIFAGTEEQIAAAVATAKNTNTWNDEDLTDTTEPFLVSPPTREENALPHSFLCFCVSRGRVQPRTRPRETYPKPSPDITVETFDQDIPNSRSSHGGEASPAPGHATNG